MDFTTENKYQHVGREPRQGERAHQEKVPEGLGTAQALTKEVAERTDYTRGGVGCGGNAWGGGNARPPGHLPQCQTKRDNESLV